MLRSYITLYEVTKDVIWLKKLVEHADIIIGHATDTDGDGFLDWKTSKYSHTGASYPYLVFDGLLSYPMARFIRLVDQNKKDLAQFSEKAKQYRSFIENEIVPKWTTANSYVGNCWSEEGYFSEPTNFDSLPSAVFTPLPYNMMSPYALMLWTMYDVNGITSYKEKADQMALYFAKALRNKNSGYEWWYWKTSKPHLEDTSHGNLDVDMAIEAFNRNVVTGMLMQGLSNTLINQMWNQSVTSPKVKSIINGTGNEKMTKYLTGWVKLSQFEPLSWTIAAEQFRNTEPGNFNEAHTLAQIIAWDPVKLQNQGFEYKSAADYSLPACWNRLGNSKSAIMRSTNKVDLFEGKAVAKITSNYRDQGRKALYQDWKDFMPEVAYELSFNVKSSGSAIARVVIYNNITHTIIGTAHDYRNKNWSSATSFIFKAPASGTARIYLENINLNGTGSAYFDNVKIKRVGDSF
jgi:hypothetical protein